MESFTDKISVTSRVGAGTKITMYKVFRERST